MSEYASVSIKKYEFTWMQNYLDLNKIAPFFSDRDLKIKKNVKYDPDDKEENPHTQYVYETTVKKAKERLDASGYTISRFKKLFIEKGYKIIDFDPYIFHINKNIDTYEDYLIELFEKNITYKKWINSFKTIVKYEKKYGKIRSKLLRNEEYKPKLFCEKVIYRALIDEDFSCLTYGLKISEEDILYVYRLVLEEFKDNEIISCDFTALFNWSEDSVPEPLTIEGVLNKTIVLVEGTTDKKIIDFCIQQMYPHLSDLIYVMNFIEDNNKRPGGASYVANNISAFYYSKLNENFIAILDNDAEGYVTQQRLIKKLSNLPSTMKILTYPEIKQFRKYPAISPNNKIELCNINKKACSIELYLPDFMIKDKRNKYLPIIWSSRKEIDNKAYFYQGVIDKKDDIENIFNDYVDKIKSNHAFFKPKQWTRMRSLIDSILYAFK